jgi:hypothetical protein
MHYIFFSHLEHCSWFANDIKHIWYLSCCCFELSWLEVIIEQVGSSSSEVGLGQFDLLKKITSDRVWSIYILIFFRFYINFDWMEDYLILDRVGINQSRNHIEPGHFFLNQIGSNLDSNGLNRFFRSERIFSPLIDLWKILDRIIRWITLRSFSNRSTK